MERIENKKKREEKGREKEKEKETSCEVTLQLDGRAESEILEIEDEKYDDVPCLIDTQMGLLFNLKHLYLVTMRSVDINIGYTIRNRNIKNNSTGEYKIDGKILNRLKEIEKRLNKTGINCKIESIGCEIVPAKKNDKFLQYINLFLLNNFGNQIQSLHINYDTDIFDQKQKSRLAVDADDQDEAENTYLSKWHFLNWNERSCSQDSKKKRWFPRNLCELSIYNLKHKQFFNNLLSNVFIITIR